MKRKNRPERKISRKIVATKNEIEKLKNRNLVFLSEEQYQKRLEKIQGLESELEILKKSLKK